MIFFLYVRGAWGMDGGRMPLPTRPQRYCDSASLVVLSKEGETRLGCFVDDSCMAVVLVIATNWANDEV